VGLGPKLEGHPFDLDVLAPDGVSERKLRQVAERSDVIRVDVDLQRHDEFSWKDGNS
jgi:hypothetical protein